MIFPAPLKPLLDALQGFEIKAVGGFARAYILGQPLPHDVDLAIAATPETLTQTLQSHGLPFTAQGGSFGSFSIELEEYNVDLTCLRADTYLPGSRYPQATFGVGWEADAARRDFTLNAIYVDENGHIFDPYHALSHLTAGLVQFVGDPFTSLSHDPLRWLRFWRFSALYGLSGYSPQVHAALAQAVPALASLSRSRVGHEVAKLLTHPHAADVLAIWKREGWLPLVQSRVDAPTASVLEKALHMGQS